MHTHTHGHSDRHSHTHIFMFYKSKEVLSMMFKSWSCWLNVDLQIDQSPILYQWKSLAYALLIVKVMDGVYLLCFSFFTGNVGGKKKKDGNKASDEKQRNYVHMPPELLVSIDVRIDVLRSFYLLPSLMHRVESLMLASQLREEISRHCGDLHISSSLVCIFTRQKNITSFVPD